MAGAIRLAKLFPFSEQPVIGDITISSMVKRCGELGLLTAKDLFGLTELQLCDSLDVPLSSARVRLQNTEI